MLKLCVECGEEKSLDDFYRAGKYRQKLCKKCHNLNRMKYPVKSNYKKKKIGFAKLPTELQETIIEALKVSDSKAVTQQYGRGHFTYPTFRKWINEGQLE